MTEQDNHLPVEVTAITHPDAKRRNIPTQEMQSVMTAQANSSVRVAYEKRNPDLDPQFIWRGKYDGDEELACLAPPLFVQEKVKPQVLIEELRAFSRKSPALATPELFADFNGLPNEEARTEFYQHDCNWQNRMILGDSLQVMASLDAKEGMRGQVQCIYLDPPYGIKFNSNFQWSTTSTNVRDGKDITREPEMVKAFRDTWRLGVHSYLTYLRDRLVVARELLAETGSIFVQIGDENVHRVRAVLDEVFGEDNFISEIFVSKTGSQSSNFIGNVTDIILWYGKAKDKTKYRSIFFNREERSEEDASPDPIKSSGNNDGDEHPFLFHGMVFKTGPNDHWKTADEGMVRLGKADRIVILKNSIRYKRFYQDYPVKAMTNIWTDLGGATNMVYIVQTATKIIERCILMTTDPGDLVLDPTCGSGTTAYVAEQWGRRWITIDTSRVALALARARIIGARYPYYLLADSVEGRQKEAELTHTAPKSSPVSNNIRKGFVYERVPHITLKSIANNAEIDVIYEKFQKELEPIREELNASLKTAYEEWEIPREEGEDWPERAKALHAKWWQIRLRRQQEIDASISARADIEYLYDHPFVNNRKIRVSGPFTVESLSPHRYVPVDENDHPVCGRKPEQGEDSGRFVEMILETMKVSGIQQAHKADKINFLSLTPWSGEYICAEGRYAVGETERRAGIFVGPEFGTVSRTDLVSAAREAAEAGFDVVIACGFNFDAASSEMQKLGRIPVLKARMNADLHMAGELKNTGAGNLFVIFGEPDIEITEAGANQIRVRLRGVDVFRPGTGEVTSSNPDEIACWFIDTDYDEESFFIRHAYFLGANDPYSALKKSLRAEIDRSAWESLHSSVSRPFEKPESGRIAVKVINHLGDEVLKVFKV